MPEDPVAIPQRRRRRFPSLGDARTQDFIGIRQVVPNGDRRDRPESSCSEYERTVAPRHDRIVRELVLDYDVANDGRYDRSGRLTPTPSDDVGQGFERFELCGEARELGVGESGAVTDVHGPTVRPGYFPDC
jgi:hypothetical protein